MSYVFLLDALVVSSLELACKPYQRRKRVGLHLSHNVPAMDLDGVFGDPQLEGCLLVQQTS
jgi:hypothetical protein